MITFSNSNIQPRAAEKQKMKQSGPRAINRHPAGVRIFRDECGAGGLPNTSYQLPVANCRDLQPSTTQLRLKIFEDENEEEDEDEEIKNRARRPGCLPLTNG
jgi:hypothetical protein